MSFVFWWKQMSGGTANTMEGIFGNSLVDETNPDLTASVRVITEATDGQVQGQLLFDKDQKTRSYRATITKFNCLSNGTPVHSALLVIEK